MAREEGTEYRGREQKYLEGWIAAAENTQLGAS